jgi:glucosamine--fructose-6-phosphate aminotransferase (isomerizing)
MCGLVGIIGDGNSVASALLALEKLEYRGYDSAGVAYLSDGRVKAKKAVGRLSALNGRITPEDTGATAIAHTRWATHGAVTEENSHPHLSMGGKVAIVHNGIVENYKELRDDLMAAGFTFKSQTDTEVIPNLIEMYMTEGREPLEAMSAALARLEGSFAIAMLATSAPDKIFFAKKTSPLVVGLGKGRGIVASSLVAMAGLADEFVVLGDGEIGALSPGKIEVFDLSLRPLHRPREPMEGIDIAADKGEFEHFMLKEIHEQPKVFKRIVSEYIDEEARSLRLPPFPFDLAAAEDIAIVACGTAYHAGLVAKYLIEDIAHTRVSVDVSSEFRYRNAPLAPGGLAIVISQSGETADTIAALNYCREKGQKIVSIVNVPHSTIALASDVVLQSFAGTEVAVASTKAFTAQVEVLYLFALELARAKGLLPDPAKAVAQFIAAGKVLDASFAPETLASIRDAADKLATDADFLACIGRGVLFPMALESALKIEEVSYIPALGLASGELKHGPISLVGGKMFTLALNNSHLLMAKNASSIEEIAARGGRIVLIGDTAGAAPLMDKVSMFIRTADAATPLEILLASAVPIQLLAYYTSLARGLDVDKPRNLAKSVTVE